MIPSRAYVSRLIEFAISLARALLLVCVLCFLSNYSYGRLLRVLLPHAEGVSIPLHLQVTFLNWSV